MISNRGLAWGMAREQEAHCGLHLPPRDGGGHGWTSHYLTTGQTSQTGQIDQEVRCGQHLPPSRAVMIDTSHH